MVLAVCACLPSGRRILDVFFSQKNMNNSEDTVVNATYFLQIRELVTSLNPEYKTIGVVGADCVVSLARGGVSLLGRLRSALGDDERNRGNSEWANSGVQSDLAVLVGIVRKICS